MQLPRLSGRRRLIFYACYALSLLLLSFGAAELAVRLKGLQPWQPEDPGITVEPGGHLFQPDPKFGFTHIPGHYTITLPSGYSFQVTHNKETLRITHPETASTGDREEVWIFGCSFTYGWSVNDEETYPWLLEEQRPQYEVVNFAVNGYGTLHAYLQFLDALESRGTPRYVIVAYASFHDERNVFARFVQKFIVPWNRLGPLLYPYARLNDDGSFRYAWADLEYRESPLMKYSAFIHYLETLYDQREFASLHARDVSHAILLEMAKVARDHGTGLLIADIGYPPSVRDFAKQNGIQSADIGLDPSVPENTNLPDDSHPSAAAHRHYANEVASLLDRVETNDRNRVSFVRMGDPAAENQIVTGVYGLESGAWRWMSKRAVIRLRTPKQPSVLVVSLHLPEQAPGRRIELEVNGSAVTETVLSGPGDHEIVSPVLPELIGDSATVSVSVDRTFTAPGDSRELGVILNAVGFREQP